MPGHRNSWLTMSRPLLPIYLCAGKTSFWREPWRCLPAGVLTTQCKAEVGPSFNRVVLPGGSKPCCVSADVNAQGSAQTNSISSPAICHRLSLEILLPNSGQRCGVKRDLQRTLWRTLFWAPCLCPSKFIRCSPNSQWDGIWKWGLGKETELDEVLGVVSPWRN